MSLLFLSIFYPSHPIQAGAKSMVNILLGFIRPDCSLGQIPVSVIWGPFEPKLPPPEFFSYIQAIRGRSLICLSLSDPLQKIKISFPSPFPE